MRKFDVVVIGSGPGGYVAAIRAAQLGAKVAVIENGSIGGVCTNAGCIPSKTMIRLAEISETLEFARSFGIKAEMTVNDPFVLAEKRKQMTEKLSSGILSLLQLNGVDVIRGTARMASATQVNVTTESRETEPLEAGSVIIATGSSASPPPIFSKGKRSLTGRDFLLSKTLPKSAVIAGGGPEGVEFACMLPKLGCKTTIIEAADRVLPAEDAEMSRLITESMKEKGAEVLTGTTVTSVTETDASALVKTSSGREINAEAVIVCIGTRPNTEGLGLEKAGIKQDAKGMITVNDRMKTSAKGVYAVGDVTGGRYAHEAMEQGIVAAENALGMGTTMAGKAIPRCIYSMPEIAAVGMTEEEAMKRRSSVLIGRFSFKASGRAMTLGCTTGIAKVIIDKTTRKFLGVHLLSDRASDIIGEAVLAMQYLDADTVIAAVHPHPSLSEALREAVLDACGRPIHSMGKRRIRLGGSENNK